jgi:hypothetical protein
MPKILAWTVIATLLSAGPALSAESTADALRKACQKELTTFCKGVPEGQGRILACFYAFEDKVSDKCMYALYEASVQLEQAATALKYAASSCKDDLEKFCGDVKLGEGRGLACLKKNEKSVSQSCNDALKQTGLKK